MSLGINKIIRIIAVTAANTENITPVMLNLLF